MILRPDAHQVSRRSFLSSESRPGNGGARNQLLIISSYPPRECGIATYSDDLAKAINRSFKRTFQPVVCALETEIEKHSYPSPVKYTLNTSNPEEYHLIAEKINSEEHIKAVLIQHEFGLFEQPGTRYFPDFLASIYKPVSIVFHTVLPDPDLQLKEYVAEVAERCQSIIVMTKSSSTILTSQYKIDGDKITVIPHGTHQVRPEDKQLLKKKYNLAGRKVLSTFGLLNPGKGIETTIHALPSIIEKFPETVFLILGKTHPGVVRHHGEAYRESLIAMVKEKGLQDHVRFVNQYISLDDLLEYLQLSDIYLFTSLDRKQAVSGTFAYAMSCGCAIVSTPIPHAMELIGDHAGLLFDFGNPEQLSERVLRLLSDDELRNNLGLNALHVISATSWENSAIAHVQLFKNMLGNDIKLRYEFPDLNFAHINRLTDDFGMIQFSRISIPDKKSGYTLDDNARALVAMLTAYELSGKAECLKNIKKYINLLICCCQPGGIFLNYINGEGEFVPQNFNENLEDAHGRAVWAMGYALSKEKLLPEIVTGQMERKFFIALDRSAKIHSPRAMAFMIKGIYYYLRVRKSALLESIADELAQRLFNKFRDESSPGWSWFESYLTYANSVLPEAMLLAYQVTHKDHYKEVAVQSLDFLLSKTFTTEQIQVVSNNGWYFKERINERYGEQPIEVSYTVMTLGEFFRVTGNAMYHHKMQIAFSWFLGNNHLSRSIYNPATGGCFDGLEQHHVNLNQGAESTVCYLLARLTIEKYFRSGVHHLKPMESQARHESDLRTAS